jgi:hypothetical protein
MPILMKKPSAIQIQDCSLRAGSDFFSSSLKRCQRKKPQKLANPARPLIFWPLKTDSDRLASRPQFNKFLGHCLVSRVARVI